MLGARLNQWYAPGGVTQSVFDPQRVRRPLHQTYLKVL
jgi:hypothetical protein